MASEAADDPAGGPRPRAADTPAADAEDRSTGDDAAGGGSASSADPVATADDPRLDPEFVRTVPGEDADVRLVGVVHDHPAAVHRVRRVIRAYDPAVVALELPGVAVPLYEAYARDGRSPPAFGGEMSAAVAAAGDARVVGVDAPDRRFLRGLAGRLRRERPPSGVVGRLLRGLAAATRHALVCRLAAALAGRTGLRVEVDDPVDHAVDADDPPAVQAEDERRQRRRGRSLLNAVETPVTDLRDDLREDSVAANLVDLRREADGDVVAVLGHDHLDGVAKAVRRGTG